MSNKTPTSMYVVKYSSAVLYIAENEQDAIDKFREDFVGEEHDFVVEDVSKGGTITWEGTVTSPPTLTLIN